jgi:BirA family biotin operon repressor/biotin-[acetyl-CoA-carboxylase] ligase
LIKESILKRLKTDDVKLILLEEIDSTNEYLKALARSGACEKTVVVAERQNNGKGTKNRTFISEKGGVYLSLLIKPSLTGFNATSITPMTAVAVSDAINQISGKKTQIKWVNDVYLQGKKVCGILCESVMDSCGKIPYIIVGIGVNLFKPKGDFAPEIRQIATSVFEEENTEIKEEFIAKLIDLFFFYYADLPNKTFLQRYREKNIVIGKEIDILSSDNHQKATALEIDDDCRLVALLPDNSKIVLSSGEVTIRL